MTQHTASDNNKLANYTGYQCWLTYQFWIGRALLIIVATFTFARTIELFYYGRDAIEPAALFNDFWLGFRLDIKTGLILLFPVWLISFCQFSFACRKIGVLKKISGFWIWFSCLFAIYGSMVNFFYYGAFNNYIDIFIFEFFEWENFVNVSRTLLSDYPVIPGFILLALFGYLLAKYLLPLKNLKWLSHFRPNLPVKILSVAVIFLLFFGFARGAIDARPLTLGRAPVSTNTFYNKLMPNGLWAFFEAWKDLGNRYRFAEIKSEMVANAIAQQTNRPALMPPQLSSLQMLTTKKAEGFQSPNVVFISMESMGAHVMSFHSARTNLLGRLEKHIKQDWLFNNFYATSMTTANTLDRILIGQPFNLSIASGRLQNTHFKTSVAWTFKNAGYETWFVTTGRKNFTNLGNFLAIQGFDHIADEFSIKEAIPEAKGGRAWGIYDEYGYQFIQKLLEKTEKPLFVVFLTTTNHSPFEPPETYQGYPLDISPLAKQSVIKDKSRLKQILHTYQYSSDALGGFMDNLKANPNTVSSTLVGATGDHYLRHVFAYDKSISGLQNKYRVPFYLYLPQAYQSDLSDKHLLTQRLGSHKDIFATLFNRALDHAPYYALGTDLLSPHYDSSKAFAENIYFTTNQRYAIQDTPQGDLNLKWNNGKLLPASPVETKKLRATRDNYRQLLNWLVKCQYKPTACPDFD